jgi:hypothetical protein
MAVTAEKIVNFILVRITHKCKEFKDLVSRQEKLVADTLKCIGSLKIL